MLSRGPAVVQPADLVGPVRRTLLVAADGSRDTTTTVLWLQGPTLFVDLRLPAGEPKALGRLGGPTDLEHAPPEVLDALAAREGFAGRFGLDGDLARWDRLVDWHPQTGVPDEGTLALQGDVVVETGVHAPYVEHWRPEPPSDPGDAAAVLLHEDGTGRTGVLVRVGARFGLARSRPAPLPDGTRLADLLHAAGPADRAALLDCEVSLGRVEPGGRWVVELSTLPWRAGRDLAPLDAGRALSTTDLVVRRWHVVSREGGTLVPAIRGAVTGTVTGSAVRQRFSPPPTTAGGRDATE